MKTVSDPTDTRDDPKFGPTPRMVAASLFSGARWRGARGGRDGSQCPLANVAPHDGQLPVQDRVSACGNLNLEESTDLLIV